METIRGDWERTLLPVCEINLGHKFLVVLKAENDIVGNTFYCHRYFKIGQGWHVSVDRDRVELPQVWGWLEQEISGDA